MLVPYPVINGKTTPSKTLHRALSDLTARSSSAAYMAAHDAAVAGLPRKSKRAQTLKRRADDARVQQLRGIFAAHNSKKDGFLSKA